MNNNVAKHLQGWGIFFLICGILGGLVLMCVDNFLLGLIVLISGVPIFIVYLGFAETLELLQRSADLQKEILYRLNNPKPSASSMAQPS